MSSAETGCADVGQLVERAFGLMTEALTLLDAAAAAHSAALLDNAIAVLPLHSPKRDADPVALHATLTSAQSESKSSIRR